MRILALFLLMNITIWGQNGILQVDSTKIIKVEEAISHANSTHLSLSITSNLFLAGALLTESPELILISIPLVLTSSFAGSNLAYFELDENDEGWRRTWSRGLILSTTYFSSFFLAIGTTMLLDPENKYEGDKSFGYIFIGIFAGSIINSYVSTLIDQDDSDYLRNLIYRNTHHIELGLSPSYSPKTKSLGLNFQMKF